MKKLIKFKCFLKSENKNKQQTQYSKIIIK